MSFNTFCGQDPTNAATFQKVLLRFQEGGGGGGVVAVNAAAAGNITIPNPLIPVVSVANPLNAVLNLGTQSITGTTGSMTLINAVGTSQSILNANQLRIQDTAVLANGILLNENALAVSGGGGGETITYGSSNIVKTGGAMGISAPTGLSIIAGIGVSINSGTAPVQITQPVGFAGSKLTTSILNVDYYGDFVIDNNNSTAVVPIPPPNYNGQRLTCIARGIFPLASWQPFGNNALLANPNGVFATYVASTGEVWVARTDSNKIEIWDSTFSGATSIAQIAVTGGSARVYCFHEESGYMFFGGSFIDVAGTAQNGLGRVLVSNPYAVDQLLDTATSVNGVNTTLGTQGVFTIESRAGYLYGGGEFQQFTPTGTAANYIFSISGYTLATGSQVYDFVDGGTNAPVYVMKNLGTYLFIGGAFNQVGTSFLPYNYLVTWDGASWGFTDANLFNAPVSIIQNVSWGNYLFIAGDFNHTVDAFSCYIDYNTPTSINIQTNLTLQTPYNSRGGSFYNGTTFINTTTQGIFSSVSQGVWVNQGTAVNATPSFFGFIGGFLVVAYLDAADYYKQIVPAQTSTFTLTSGNFEFNNVATYTSAVFTLPDVAQSFIGVDCPAAPKYILLGFNPYITYF